MNALQAGVEVADTVRACGTAVPAQRLLVVAVEDVTASDLDGVADEAALYRLPGNSAASHDPWLPFDDEAFDIVVLYRVTSHNVDMQLLLGETARVLRAKGNVLVLVHQADFSFAPLPDTGPAHLLNGWLREAGFASVDLSRHGESRLVAVAQA